MYKFREEEYENIDDVYSDVYNDDFLFEQYLREALSQIAPMRILGAIRAAKDYDLDEEIGDIVTVLISEDVEVIDE